MKKKLLSVLLTVAVTASLLGGCGSKKDDTTTTTPTPTEAAATDEATATPTADATGLAYKGDLSLMHFSTSEESQGNGGSDGFRTMISEWEKANPDVKLNQNVLANADYKTQIATLAAANNLPDVFLLQGMNTKQWAKDGLILDMTQIIKDSPDYAQYNQNAFYPFTTDGKEYGLPALTGGTCTVVVYDAAKWKEAGYDTFPATWDEVLKAKDYFSKQKIDTIAFGNGGQWQANSTFLDTIGDRFTGADWTHSLIEKKGAKFTDKAFVDALKFTKDIFASGIFNADFNAVTNEDAREYYINGSAAAYIGGNWDVSYIGATLKESNPDLYGNTKFAVLPQPTGATASEGTNSTGMGYAVAINAKLADQPDKLAAAVNLAYKLTGADFSNYVASNYALGGLTKVENVDLSKFDQFTQDFYKYSYVDSKPCEIYDSFITGAVWSTLNADLQTMLNGQMSPEDVAKNAQKSYDDNY